MISERAPGKLFVAGEYAVVEPGRHAILTAVDRYATATVRASHTDAAVTVCTDLGQGVQLACRRAGTGLVPANGRARPPAELAYVFAAAAVVERLLIERGHPVLPCRVAVTADLADRSGRKFGLGASAAVTAATVAALGRFHRLGLSRMDRYRLAMLATLSVDPAASGGDVAASTWGGWLVYGSPDRRWVSETLATRSVTELLSRPWPGLSVHRLPPPARSALRVGWTGTPVATPGLVRSVRRGRDRRAGDYRAFVAATEECVRALARALEADEPGAVHAGILRARELLVRLDSVARAGIMTPRLRALCAAGDAVGAAAKPSGAGGGDCGIAFLDPTDTAALAELADRWRAAGIEPLTVRPHPRQEADT
ncbi:phosphomevalonate kinase [Nocardia farcinica]|uniref:phosphomevalonate kinase n=1 Tax=Nocardia farcinica TaxID=37329 RepID=UPI001895C1D4|nr:phosphomevalonate kinase [Nocardia farcinica]MBF6267707.1 phosphomevalonate kinase [Nocardia farcinica]MCZ9327185.1 phosphomevalonate kinase [Nocardia farcinica]